MGVVAPQRGLLSKPGAWGELALTFPVFLAYQVGVVFLGVRNATDVVTVELLQLVQGDRFAYLGLTGAIGLIMVASFAISGRGQALRPGKLAQIALEGAFYAALMTAGTSWVVGKLFAGHPPPAGGPLSGLVMSLGAGFYEEIAFRVVLFGLGGRLLIWLFVRARASGTGANSVRTFVWTCLWALVSAAVFSGMHYVGPLGDALDVRSFVARAVLGLALTLVYGTRGFAAAVWTHTLYDIWVLVL